MQWRIQDFPWGAWTHLGGVDPRRGCFSAKMYEKRKELGPNPPTPARSANDMATGTRVYLASSVSNARDNDN